MAQRSPAATSRGPSDKISVRRRPWTRSMATKAWPFSASPNSSTRTRDGWAHEPAGQEPDRDFVTGRLVLGQGHVPEGADPQIADDPIAALRHRRRPRQALRGVANHGASRLKSACGFEGTEPKAGDKVTRERVKHRRIAMTLARRAGQGPNGPRNRSPQPPAL